MQHFASNSLEGWLQNSMFGAGRNALKAKVSDVGEKLLMESGASSQGLRMKIKPDNIRFSDDACLQFGLIQASNKTENAPGFLSVGSTQNRFDSFIRFIGQASSGK